MIIPFLLMLALGLTSPAAYAQSSGSAPPPAFKITDVLFEDSEGWPAQHYQVKAGGDVVLTFRATGFAQKPGTDERGLPQEEVKLHYEVQMTDPSGTPVEAAKQGQVNTILSSQDSDWKPLMRWSGRIPATAPSGDYRVIIRLTDQVANREIENKTSFRVSGQIVPSADKLSIIQLEFARTPDGPWFGEGYFSLRDAVNVRFYVVGYRVASDKRVAIEQDWTVLDADGKVVMSQPNAITENSQDFYSPRFIPTFLSMKLTDPKPGTYTLKIDLRDRIGGQTLSFPAEFVLRP